MVIGVGIVIAHDLLGPGRALLHPVFVERCIAAVDGYGVRLLKQPPRPLLRQLECFEDGRPIYDGRGRVVGRALPQPRLRLWKIRRISPSSPPHAEQSFTTREVSRKSNVLSRSRPLAKGYSHARTQPKTRHQLRGRMLQANSKRKNRGSARGQVTPKTWVQFGSR